MHTTTNNYYVTTVRQHSLHYHLKGASHIEEPQVCALNERCIHNVHQHTFQDSDDQSQYIPIPFTTTSRPLLYSRESRYSSNKLTATVIVLQIYASIPHVSSHASPHPFQGRSLKSCINITTPVSPCPYTSAPKKKNLHTIQDHW